LNHFVRFHRSSCGTCEFLFPLVTPPAGDDEFTGEDGLNWIKCNAQNSLATPVQLNPGTILKVNLTPVIPPRAHHSSRAHHSNKVSPRYVSNAPLGLPALWVQILPHCSAKVPCPQLRLRCAHWPVSCFRQALVQDAGARAWQREGSVGVFSQPQGRSQGALSVVISKRAIRLNR